MAARVCKMARAMTNTTTTNTRNLTGELVTLYVMRGCNKIALSIDQLATDLDFDRLTVAFRQKNLSEFLPQGAIDLGNAEEQPEDGNPEWAKKVGQVTKERGLPLYRFLVIELTNNTDEQKLLATFLRENFVVGFEVEELETVTQYKAELLTWAETLGELMDQQILWGDDGDEKSADLLLSYFEKECRSYEMKRA